MIVILIAQSPISSLGSRFRSETSQWNVWHLLGLGIILVGLAALAWLLTRHFQKKDRQGYHSERRLFRELCVAHGLTWQQRRILKQLAAACGLANPSQLFLEPKWFDSGHARRAAAGPQLGEIQTTLFGDSATSMSFNRNGRDV